MGNGENLSVLIIDDEAGIRSALSKILEKRGFHIDSSPDIEDGRAKISEKDYDLLIVDLYMPGGDGLQFISTLMANKHVPKLPKILVITGGLKNASASDASQNNMPDAIFADGFLKKPFTADQILSEIHNISELENQA